MRKPVLLIWCALLLRGAFYCSALPLWEGFDEWAHFGVIEQMRSARAFLIDRNTKVSPEINASLELTPLPRGMTRIPEHGLTHEMYWTLDRGARVERATKLVQLGAVLPSSPASSTDLMPAYEASQPPLYYWIVAIALRALSPTSLLSRIWFARYLTFMIGSLVIPIGYYVFRHVWNDESVAIGSAIVLAAAPGLSLNIARVSNEGLGIAVFTLLTFLLLKVFQNSDSLRYAVCVGTVLGLGLLTKAYFLTAVPAIAVIYSYACWTERKPWFVAARSIVIVFAVAALIGGWWYVRNLAQTGTLTGLDEALMVRELSVSQEISAALGVNWVRAIATILLSHIWYGGWSLLSLPRWIYYLSFAVIAAACFGLWRSTRRGVDAKSATLLAVYACFWIGQGYQILMLFVSKGSSTAMAGWYLYALCVAEVVLLYSGLSAIVPHRARRFVLPGLTAVLAAIDLYGLDFISLPYYAQMSGSVRSVLERLAENKPGFLNEQSLFILWAIYLITTGVLAAAAFTIAASTASRVGDPSSNEPVL